MDIYTGKVTLTFNISAQGKHSNEAVMEMYSILTRWPYSHLTGFNVNAKQTIESVRLRGGAY